LDHITDLNSHSDRPFHYTTGLDMG
jgi:hypothetical protein